MFIHDLERLRSLWFLIPLSKAMRNSRLRCSSLMNSSFCRNRAMRSSSRYCFSFLSCSVAPAGTVEPPVVPAALDRGPEWAVHWLIKDTEEEEEDEGWDRLLWELCRGKHRRGYWLMWFHNWPFAFVRIWYIFTYSQHRGSRDSQYKHF